MLSHGMEPKRRHMFATQYCHPAAPSEHYRPESQANKTMTHLTWHSSTDTDGLVRISGGSVRTTMLSSLDSWSVYILNHSDKNRHTLWFDQFSEGTFSPLYPNYLNSWISLILIMALWSYSGIKLP